MAKGLCCAAQAAGDLGKPLLVTIHHKDGTQSQRCGVCEVVPSCKHPQNRVFAFRFLHANVCGLTAAKCQPSAAGIAQYTREIGVARAAGEATEYIPSNGAGRPITFTPRAILGTHVPYTLPSP